MEKEELIEIAEEIGSVLGRLEQFEKTLWRIERLCENATNPTLTEIRILYIVRALFVNKDDITELYDAVEERIDEVENETKSEKE